MAEPFQYAGELQDIRKERKMSIIPYSFIPGEKARRLSNNKPEFIEEQQECDFIKNNPVLIHSYYDQNGFKRIWSDGLVEEGIKSGNTIKINRRYAK